MDKTKTSKVAKSNTEKFLYKSATKDPFRSFRNAKPSNTNMKELYYLEVMQGVDQAVAVAVAIAFACI